MNKGKKQGNSPRLMQFLAIPISGIIFWYLIINISLWVPNLAELLKHIQPTLIESDEWRIGGLTILVGIAFTLYIIKNKILIIFALIEITGGGWTIWATLTQKFENNILYALAIGGGIFLLVNGFENGSKYYDDERS